MTAARPPIAYLVLSHTHPYLVARLSDRLLRGDEECHVVVDHESAAPAVEPWLPRHPRLHTRVSERPGGWGGYGLVSAVRDAFVDIRRELDPDWIVLLSGQDYPVQPPRDLRHKLQSSSADVHLTVLCQVPGDARGGLARWWHVRYYFRWWSLPPLPFVLPARIRRRRVHAVHRFSMAQRRLFLWSLPRGSGTRIGVPRAETPFSDSYPCWAGYQWLALSRHGLETLERELSARPELVELYKTSVIPDESMIQTVLLNAPDLVTAEPNLTFQRPTGEGDAHAAELTLDDLPAILASGRAFARKMHPDRSRALMDALDERLGLLASARPTAPHSRSPVPATSNPSARDDSVGRSVDRAREAALFGLGLGMGATNTIRHRVRGYVNPRPFAASDVQRTIAHAVGVVDRLETSGGINWRGKRVLEIGPGSDLATGAVMVHRGASSYCAVDLFDNRGQADPALYAELSRTLGAPIDPAVLDFCQTKFPELPDLNGHWDVIVSNATLEHIAEIPALFRRLAQLAGTEARMVHHVDAQTHMRWIREIDPWNILRYPGALYDRVLRFPGAPNRLLAGDYVRAAESSGWSAASVDEDLRAGEEYLSRARLARPFRFAGPDLRLLTFTLVATRANGRAPDSSAS